MSEEDVFEINDFSTSSDWERFIAELEEILTQWNLAGSTTDDLSPEHDEHHDHQSPKLSAHPIKSKLLNEARLWSQKQDQLRFGKVTFTLTWHSFKVPSSEQIKIDPATTIGGHDKPKPTIISPVSQTTTTTNRAWRDMNTFEHDWPATVHALVRYYGLTQFLLLSPIGSETLNTEDRIRHLLGSAAIALNNIACEVPFFAQICSPNRRLFSGVAFANNGYRTYFDMIQFPSIPPSYQYLADLTSLFKKKLYATFSYSSAHKDKQSQQHSPVHQDSQGPNVKIILSIRFTYLLSVWPPQYLLFNGSQPSHPALEQFIYFKSDCRPAELLRRPVGFGLVANQYADPLRQIQLATTWPSVSEELLTDNAYHSDLQPRSAPRWSLRALFIDPQAKQAAKLCHTTEWLRKFTSLRLQYKNTILLSCLHQGTNAEEDVDVRLALDRLTNQSNQLLNPINTMLGHLERNLFGAVNPSNVDDTIRLIFDASHESSSESQTEPQFDRELKSAPIGSLSWRISLAMANSFADSHQITTIALLWKSFIAKLRIHWQNAELLPLLDQDTASHDSSESGHQTIDYRHCLLHQKLQMLNCCIYQKIKRERANIDKDSPKKSDFIDSLEYSENDEDDEFFDAEDQELAELDQSDAKPQGQLEPFIDPTTGQAVYRLNASSVAIFVPITQDPAPLTEDLLQRQIQTLSSMNQSGTPEDAKLKLRLQSAGLLSDMEAFKAANPGASFEDFIRWHSPRDWVELEDEPTAAIQPKFGLSRRMRDSTTWTELWELARSVPISRQKRLFNYTKEAEEILHALESITVAQFIEWLGPILAKATLGQILKFRAEIIKFISDNLDEKDELMKDVLPYEGASLELHFNRSDYEGLCLELGAIEYEVIKFYSLLKKVIFAYESEVKKPFRDLYTTAVATTLSGTTGTVKQAGLKTHQGPRAKSRINVGVPSLTKSDLIKFVAQLLLEPEVEFSSMNALSTLVVRLYADSSRFQYESSTSVGDRVGLVDPDTLHDTGEEPKTAAETNPKKPTLTPAPQLPPPSGKEFIFRAPAIARPAPYSRPSSHRFYCFMSPKGDFRIATAFTEDVAYF